MSSAPREWFSCPELPPSIAAMERSPSPTDPQGATEAVEIGPALAQPGNAPRQASATSAQPRIPGPRMASKAEGECDHHLDDMSAIPTTIIPRSYLYHRLSNYVFDGEDSLASSVHTSLTSASTIETPGPSSPTRTVASDIGSWCHAAADVSPLRHPNSLPTYGGHKEISSRPRTPSIDADIPVDPSSSLSYQPSLPKNAYRIRFISPLRSTSLPLRPHLRARHRSPTADWESAQPSLSAAPTELHNAVTAFDSMNSPTYSASPFGPSPHIPMQEGFRSSAASSDGSISAGSRRGSSVSLPVKRSRLTEPEITPSFGSEDRLRSDRWEVNDSNTTDDEKNDSEQIDHPCLVTAIDERSSALAPKKPGQWTSALTWSVDSVHEERLADDACNFILKYLYGVELEDLEAPIEAWATVNHCLEELANIVDIKPAIGAFQAPVPADIEHSTTESGSASVSGIQRSTSEKSSNGSFLCRKRANTEWNGSDARDDEGSDGDGGSTGPGKGKKIKTAGVDLKLSCPFRKRNPARFNIRSNLTCATQFFPSFYTLKRHVRAFHRRKPDSHPCPRCKVAMGTKDALDQHLNADIAQMCESRPCVPASINDPEDGITDQIDDMLTERKSNCKIDNWTALWQALFPRTEVPYPDFEPPVELDEVEEQFKREAYILDNQILDEIRVGFPHAPELEVADISNRIRDVCKNFIDYNLATCRQNKGSVVLSRRNHTRTRTHSSDNHARLQSRNFLGVQPRRIRVPKMLGNERLDVTNESSLSSSYETALSSAAISNSDWSSIQAPRSSSMFTPTNTSSSELEQPRSPLLPELRTTEVSRNPGYTTHTRNMLSNDSGIQISSPITEEATEAEADKYPGPTRDDADLNDMNLFEWALQTFTTETSPLLESGESIEDPLSKFLDQNS